MPTALIDRKIQRIEDEDDNNNNKFDANRYNTEANLDIVSNYGTIQEPKRKFILQLIDIGSFGSNYSIDKPQPGYDLPERKCPLGNYLRYFIMASVLLGVAMNNYTNHTLYIAAIKMISSDVLEAGLTELRAHHMSLDPLADSRNAAAPGTCPVQADVNSDLQDLVVATIESLLSNDTSAQAGPRANLTQLSLNQKLAMGQDAQLLFSYVDRQIASGHLVDWSVNQRTLLFSAHNIGAILFAIPMGQIGLRYGNKLAITLIFVTTVLRPLLLPTLVGHCNYWIVFFFEIFIGGPGQQVEVAIFPLVASWLVPSEANLIIGVAALASLLGDTLTGFLSTQMLANGVTWPWTFYVSGIFMAIVTVIWMLLAADEPETSGLISTTELRLLEGSVCKLKQAKEMDEVRLVNKSGHCACNDLTCPARRFERVANWRSIIGCTTLWTLIGCAFAANWNSKGANLWPSFFANIVHMDTETIGFLLGFRGILVVVCGLLVSIFTRNLSIRRPFNISLTAYRKWNLVFGTIFQTVEYVLFAVFDCSIWANTLGVLMTPLVRSFSAISTSQMILDLSAEDSGLIMSYIRFVSVGDIVVLPFASFVLSYASDAVVGDRNTWRFFWASGGIIKILTSLIFLVLARADVPRSYTRLRLKGACRALQRHPE